MLDAVGAVEHIETELLVGLVGLLDLVVRVELLLEVGQVAPAHVRTTLIVGTVLQEVAAIAVDHRWFVQRVELCTLQTTIETTV